jgi:DNA-binding MarR family transcriptional regulator
MTEPAVTGSLPHALACRAGFLLRLIGEEAREVAEQRLRCLDLSGAEYGVLGLLEEREGISQLEAGRILIVDRTTMVAIIDGLEQRGLVERRRNPSDRRKHALHLTQDGHAAVARAHDEVAIAEHEFFAPLTETEYTALRDYLTRLDQGRRR